MTYFIFIEVNSKNSGRTDGQGGPKPAIFEAKTAQFRSKMQYVYALFFAGLE